MHCNDVCSTQFPILIGVARRVYGIETQEEQLRTASGLLLSSEDSNQLRYKKGLIIKPGSDVSTIEEGEIVYYDKRAGFSMIINDLVYTIIQEKDIVVVL